MTQVGLKHCIEETIPTNRSLNGISSMICIMLGDGLRYQPLLVQNIKPVVRFTAKSVLLICRMKFNCESKDMPKSFVSVAFFRGVLLIA